MACGVCDQVSSLISYKAAKIRDPVRVKKSLVLCFAAECG